MYLLSALVPSGGPVSGALLEIQRRLPEFVFLQNYTAQKAVINELTSWWVEYS